MSRTQIDSLWERHDLLCDRLRALCEYVRDREGIVERDLDSYPSPLLFAEGLLHEERRARESVGTLPKS